MTVSRIEMTEGLPAVFADYEQKFKALADQNRLKIMAELCQKGETCVCDLCGITDLQQSKLSYHLRILLDAGLIRKETRGTWSYYHLNGEEVRLLLAPAVCDLLHGRSATATDEAAGCGCGCATPAPMVKELEAENDLKTGATNS
jgi:ArsR family transcriptional regulator